MDSKIRIDLSKTIGKAADGRKTGTEKRGVIKEK